MSFLEKCLENYNFKVSEMNKNSETGYIFGTKIPKPVEDKGNLWAPLGQVGIKSPRR